MYMLLPFHDTFVLCILGSAPLLRPICLRSLIGGGLSTVKAVSFISSGHNADVLYHSSILSPSALHLRLLVRSPEDRAWQNGVEKRLEHLSRTIDMILAHLGGQPPMPGPPNTAGPAFPEMPVAANGQYYESYERHGMPPNTAPPGTAGGPHAMGGDPNIGQSGMLNGPGRVQYVVPSAAETAAIAAQARMKRQRGNTLP